MFQQKISSLTETKTFAKNLASKIRPGDNFGLVGDLGAGKTTLVQMLIKELGAKDQVQSPTFSIINTYQLANQVTIYHADLYRLDSLEEIINIGIVDFLEDQNSICFIEWADKAQAIVANSLNWIKIDIKETNRLISTSFI